MSDVHLLTLSARLIIYLASCKIHLQIFIVIFDKHWLSLFQKGVFLLFLTYQKSKNGHAFFARFHARSKSRPDFKDIRICNPEMGMIEIKVLR